MTQEQVIENYLKWWIPQFTYKRFIDRDAYYYGGYEVIKVYRYNMSVTDDFTKEINKFFPCWGEDFIYLMKIVNELAVNKRMDESWYNNYDARTNII